MSTVRLQTMISSEIIVVYDMDDVLWGYSEVAARYAGISLSEWTDFHIEKIEALAEEKRKELRAVVGRTDFYDEIEFYPGVEDILQICELSERVHVIINSNVISQEAAIIKRQRLMETIPGISDQNMVFGLVGNGEKKTMLNKRIDPGTFIFVDDSPYNILTSPAVANIMPQKPWNTTQGAKKLLFGKAAFYATDLQRANQMVQALVSKQLQRDRTVTRL